MSARSKPQYLNAIRKCTLWCQNWVRNLAELRFRLGASAHVFASGGCCRHPLLPMITKSSAGEIAPCYTLEHEDTRTYTDSKKYSKREAQPQSQREIQTQRWRYRHMHTQTEKHKPFETHAAPQNGTLWIRELRLTGAGAMP
eukprot:735778-Rhodomonas_salina.1